jgi:hypothetical protein
VRPRAHPLAGPGGDAGMRANAPGDGNLGDDGGDGDVIADLEGFGFGALERKALLWMPDEPATLNITSVGERRPGRGHILPPGRWQPETMAAEEFSLAVSVGPVTAPAGATTGREVKRHVLGRWRRGPLARRASRSLSVPDAHTPPRRPDLALPPAACLVSPGRPGVPVGLSRLACCRPAAPVPLPLSSPGPRESRGLAVRAKFRSVSLPLV